MSERRKAERARIVFDTAAISVGSARALECSIRNMSSSGACLVFAQRQPALPKEFALDIEPGSARRACRLVWQSAYRVGVEFVADR